MKKFVSLLFILTLFMTACSSEPKKKALTLDETIKQMQSSVKKIDSLSAESDNETTVIYNKFTTKFTQLTKTKTNTLDQFTLKADAASNNTKYHVKSYTAAINKNKLLTTPQTNYISYQARKADKAFIEALIADHFNLTHIIQDVIKPAEVTSDGTALYYKGTDDVMKVLFDYGFNVSSLNQIEALADMTDLKVKSGDYTLRYSPAKIYPKELIFNIQLTGTIDEQPVTIHMKQTTKYYDFNKTTLK